MICFASNTPKIDEVNKLFGLPNCVTDQEQFSQALGNIQQFEWKPLLNEMCTMAKENYKFLNS
ncbi:hypothetical protein SEHO0A_01580 [Salmonella enterica subsp. houtenae str. ATCC BAA-1581]|nr:hypothetical protein SEHO0A_01580 [Salmonella enterica subsp. houtenae str. ATCC BAA-1581]VFS06208.1 Uncharacterised protein [Salmonella enterica subsp. houtenae]